GMPRACFKLKDILPGYLCPANPDPSGFVGYKSTLLPVEACLKIF
ncbi:20318_t:CDS:2, partial [Racocetra persica]